MSCQILFPDIHQKIVVCRVAAGGTQRAFGAGGVVILRRMVAIINHQCQAIQPFGDCAHPSRALFCNF